MTKEEFLKFWVKNPNELMPNPENRHKAVVIKDLFLKQLDEIISDAISNHEASQWKKYPENEPTIGHSYLIQTINNDAIIISTYNDSWSRKVIAFRELPERYKEGEPCPNCNETVNPCKCQRNICIRCGKPVGNITFTVCDACWDKKEGGEG